MLNPLVSIIIPTHNRQSLLPEAIASCLAQTYTNIEILVIDDGSTDSTETVMRSLISGAGKGKVFYTIQKNGGACSARNHGLRLARGEYIQFLDSDDTLQPDKISQQISSITPIGTFDASICHGRTGLIESGWANAQRIGYCGEKWLGMLCSRAHFVVHTSAPLWRKAFLDKENGWDEELRCAQEWEYYIRLFTHVPKVSIVADDLFWVRLHREEQISTSSKTGTHWVSRWRAIQSVACRLSSAGLMTNELQRGLLSVGCTCYINILRYAQDSIVSEFEDWLRDLARSSGDFLLVWVVGTRRKIGRNAFLRAYDTYRSTRNWVQPGSG